MKEIIIQPNQFLNLTALGNANTRLILQNQGRDVLYIFKQSSQPTEDSPCFRLFNWQSQEVDNSAGDIWVAAQQETQLFTTPSTNLYANYGDIPPDLYTSTKEGFRRIRVDTGQTGFFDGRMFELNRKITSPIVFRFVSPVPFILHAQSVSCSDGDIEMFAWDQSQVTVGGTWTPTPFWRQNENNTTYNSQVTISQGGSIVVNDLNHYRDYARVKAPSATAQQTTVTGRPSSERYHNAGTYYIQHLGTGVGSYYINWEERP